MTYLSLISKICLKEEKVDVLVLFSAYHGHLTTLFELSTYKFKKANTEMKAPEHVHVVCVGEQFVILENSI